MWLLDVKGIDKRKTYLHVPIDSYILKAATAKGEDYSLVKNGDDKDELYKFKNITWSRLEEPDYKELKKVFSDRIQLQPSGISCPIEWEAKAWIEQAKKERWQKQD